MKQTYSIILILFLFSFNLYSVKIDRVILAADANPYYLDFWPIVAKAWKELIGIKPTLILVADDSIQVDETLGDVIRFSPIPHVSIALQAQAIRLLAPCLFEHDICLISDIDMIPLSKKYFLNSVRHIAADKFIVYRDKAYGEYAQQFPMCYIAAQGSIFKEIFNVNNIDDIRSILTYWDSLKLGWWTDELMLYQYVTNWAHYKTHCVKLGHTVTRRIDRIHQWKYKKDLLKRGGYIDAHCPRPYSKNKEKIDSLLDAALN